MLHNFSIFLHNYRIFTCISASNCLYFHLYFCAISIFFNYVLAKLLHLHLCFSSICLNPNIWKATVFINCISQVYFWTVFLNCVSQLYFTAVYFPTGRKLRMRGCEATDRAPGGYRLPGSGDRPLLEVGSGH